MDELILLGKIDENGFEQDNRVYAGGGIAPTIRAENSRINTVVRMETQQAEIKRLGNLYGEKYGTNFAGNVWDKDGLCPTILTMQGGGREPMIIDEKQARVKEIGNLNLAFESQGRVYDKDGLSPTLRCFQGGGLQPKIIEDTKVVGGIGEKKSNGGTQYYQQDRVYHGDIAMCQPANLPGGSYNYIVKEKANGFFDKAVETAEKGNAEIGDTIDAFNGKVNKSGISPTITTRPEGKKTAILPVVEQYRIRKLTPRECWRLMAFSDEDFDKAASVVSNTQLYKQAGNSICVCVLMAIFSQMNIKGVKPWNERKTA